MRKFTLTLLVGLMVCSSFQIGLYAQTEEELFQEAKVLIFDKKWDRAKEKLERILQDYPDSRWYPQALFYKARCLKEQEGREAQSLDIYRSYTQLEKAQETLVEESELAIIDLSFRLINKGKKAYLEEIEERLQSGNKVIKYYAAIKLSYVKDKTVAKKGLPVLKYIAEREKDDELRDRARLAILRIDPKAFKDFEEEKDEPRARTLYIRAYKEGVKEPSFKLNVPWALADLAFSAIPEKEKTVMREEGYDIDKIIQQLLEYKGEILEIYGEGTIIKIWLR
jgi:hypothetical protein